MGKRLSALASVILTALFNYDLASERATPVQLPLKNKPTYERRNVVTDYEMLPDEGPHDPRSLLPPPLPPFNDNQSMWDAANQAIFSRERALKSVQHESFFAPPAIALIVLDSPS